jgi:hypothetical protein
MIPLRARRNARRNKLYVVDVYDVEVRRVHATERAAHAASYRVARVVKVLGCGTVASDFGQDLVGATREFVGERLEGRAEDDLRVVVVGRGVESADAVSVCVCVVCYVIKHTLIWCEFATGRLGGLPQSEPDRAQWHVGG